MWLFSFRRRRLTNNTLTSRCRCDEHRIMCTQNRYGFCSFFCVCHVSHLYFLFVYPLSLSLVFSASSSSLFFLNSFCTYFREIKSMTFEHFSRCWFTELPFVVAWNISYIVYKIHFFLLSSSREQRNRFSKAVKFIKLNIPKWKPPPIRFTGIHATESFAKWFIKLASNFIFRIHS